MRRLHNVDPPPRACQGHLRLSRRRSRGNTMQPGKIDLTRLARTWHILQNLCAIILFFALDRAAALAFSAGLDWTTAQPAAEPSSAGYAAEAAAIVYCAYLVRELWRYSGIASEAALNRLRTAMLTLAIASSIPLALGLLAMTAST